MYSVVLCIAQSTGYHILESYKDRVCTSLPADSSSTAIRLQTLIGASDHMIEWILTGDMSKVNHRIYQVVLVFVSFQPHFIKFCDIMEVLAADSMTVGHIKELRKSEYLPICTDIQHFSMHVYILDKYKLVFLKRKWGSS